MCLFVAILVCDRLWTHIRFCVCISHITRPSLWSNNNVLSFRGVIYLGLYKGKKLIFRKIKTYFLVLWSCIILHGFASGPCNTDRQEAYITLSYMLCFLDRKSHSLLLMQPLYINLYYFKQWFVDILWYLAQKSPEFQNDTEQKTMNYYIYYLNSMLVGFNNLFEEWLIDAPPIWSSIGK